MTQFCIFNKIWHIYNCHACTIFWNYWLVKCLVNSKHSLTFDNLAVSYQIWNTSINQIWSQSTKTMYKRKMNKLNTSSNESKRLHLSIDSITESNNACRVNNSFKSSSNSSNDDSLLGTYTEIRTSPYKYTQINTYSGISERGKRKKRPVWRRQSHVGRRRACAEAAWPETEPPWNCL